MTDLSTSAGVDVPQTPKGMAYPATYQAARLLGMVEALRHCHDEDYADRSHRVMQYAEKVEAHSVARAIYWGSLALGRYPISYLHDVMERAAERYLARVEARRLEAWTR